MSIRDIEKWRESANDRVDRADTLEEMADAEEEWGIMMNTLRLEQLRLEMMLRMEGITA